MNINYNAPFTPKEITTKNIMLNIPIYQRLFVWGEEQIKLLLQDLWKAAKRWEAAKQHQDPYYIGIITVVENKNGWDVVDGQQRLTFLSLFGAYVVCKMKDKSPTFYEQWKRFLYSTNTKDQRELRINYIGRPDDRADLQAIIDGNISQIGNQNFKVFLECIEDYSKKEIDFNHFVSFVSYVYENTSFLISELPNNFMPQDLNSFFEKMNSTGRQLTPVEQIKGKYFPAHASEFDACMNFELKYEKQNPEPNPNEAKQINGTLNETIVSILGSTIGVIDEKNDDHPTEEKCRSILVPEIFLLHSLIIALKQKGISKSISPDKRSILQTFSCLVGTGNILAPNELLACMLQYREWLDSNIIYLKNDGNAFDYLFWSSNSDKKNELEQLQAMLYVSSDEWQGWVLDAYCKIQGGPLSLEILKSLDNKMQQHQLPQDISTLSYGSINRYWFWKLDYILWEQISHGRSKIDNIVLNEEQIKAIINYRFRRNRSIEHLHPQTDGLPDTDPWNMETKVDNYPVIKSPKHWFGNLALISAEFNSEQSNESIRVKFAHLKDRLDNHNLESIKMLLMFLVAGGSENGWRRPDSSITHGIQMYNLLKEYYNSIPDTL